ncbi:hypothetical protein PV403_01320 [Paenibacillus sp. GYB006]|uniref:hypothetical protein n=1 Tax=Paenibacillus sp. GYB006 TaxID=2994394 RepID=UPI002F96A8CC
MSRTEIISIPLDQIHPDFQIKITNEYVKRMKKSQTDWLNYDLLLAVEKKPNQEGYRLVGGFDRYYYLKYNSNQSAAPCLLEEPTEDEMLNLKILRRLFNKGETVKENKVIVLRQLQLLMTPISKIVSKTGFSRSQLENEYVYNAIIPLEYRTKDASKKTLNWIANLESPPFNKEIINFLYKRANEKDSTKRLTLQSMELLKKLFKNEPLFFTLAVSEQERILSRAINFKGNFLQLLIKDIHELLDR